MREDPPRQVSVPIPCFSSLHPTRLCCSTQQSCRANLGDPPAPTPMEGGSGQAGPAVATLISPEAHATHLQSDQAGPNWGPGCLTRACPCRIARENVLKGWASACGKAAEPPPCGRTHGAVERGRLNSCRTGLPSTGYEPEHRGGGRAVSMSL